MAPSRRVTASREKHHRAAERVPDVIAPAPDALHAPERIRVFGELLASDLPLPGLPVALPGDGQLPFWVLRTAQAVDADGMHSAGFTSCGTQHYSNGVMVSLAAAAGGAEIVITDTGRFSLDDATRHIRHDAPRGVDRSAVALDLIGVVLPYALHRSGAWCIHASAVRTRDGVIVFIAQRGTGKSTLAAACVQQGCALIADDVVVLRQSSTGVFVVPTGVPLRLRAETARAVGASADDIDAWGKVRVQAPMATGPAALAAIYLLAPAAPDDAVVRVARPPRAAAFALLANGKITQLLGADGDALTRCVALAHVATVHDLSVPRDLGRLQDVARTLLSWHGGAASHAVVPS